MVSSILPGLSQAPLRYQFGPSPPLVLLLANRCSVTADLLRSLQVCVGEKEQKRRLLDKETKITLTVAIVVGVFILCWGPLNVMLLVYCVCQKCIPPIAMETAEVFSMLNSGCNPLIYGIFNRDFRHTFKAILTCRWRQINRERIPGATGLSLERPQSRVSAADEQ